MRIDQMYDNHEHAQSTEDNNVRFRAVPKMEMFVQIHRKNYELGTQRAQQLEAKRSSRFCR